MLSVSRPMQVVVLKAWVTRDEGDAVRLEHVHQLGEVGQRAAQAVDLVDHHHVHRPALDVGEQPLQRRPLQRAAGEAAVVVAVADQRPALGALGGDVGLAGVALGVEGVELLVEPLLGALAGVDRAAELLHLRRHRGVGPLCGGSCATSLAQAEEGPAVPARAGDVPGDGGEGPVRPALELEVVGAHRDHVLARPATPAPAACRPAGGCRRGCGGGRRCRRPAARRAPRGAPASPASGRRRRAPGCGRRAGSAGRAG